MTPYYQYQREKRKRRKSQYMTPDRQKREKSPQSVRVPCKLMTK